MNFKVISLKSNEEISKWFGDFLVNELNASANYYYLAISGGSTPKFLFEYLSAHYQNKIDWEKIKLFWVDERCVPPDNPESNYKMAYDLLFSKVKIPEQNIFRIQGEANPNFEVKNYSQKIKINVPIYNSLPRFDLILLGLGQDGHTASIFPNNLNLFQSEQICSVTQHPLTNQSRITITGNVINNAKIITFLVTGKNKSSVVNSVLNSINESKKLPASHINPKDGKLFWLLDSEAASELHRTF